MLRNVEKSSQNLLKCLKRTLNQHIVTNKEHFICYPSVNILLFWKCQHWMNCLLVGLQLNPDIRAKGTLFAHYLPIRCKQLSTELRLNAKNRNELKKVCVRRTGSSKK